MEKDSRDRLTEFFSWLSFPRYLLLVFHSPYLPVAQNSEYKSSQQLNQNTTNIVDKKSKTTVYV